MYKVNPNFLKYNLLLLGLTAGIVFCFLIIILNVTDGYKAENPLIKQAIDWQNQTKGIVAISSKLATLYKHETAPDYIANNKINTIVFGSSTMMTVRSNIFPKQFRVYNNATNSNPLHKTIGELRYLAESNERIRWAVLAVNYSLGFPFKKSPVKPYQLDSPVVDIPFTDKVRDAITLDRLKTTFKSLWNQAILDDPTYPCPKEDLVGRDFGTMRSPGICRGYRIDGSATFGLRRMSKLSWKGQLNDEGLKRYIKSLETSEGGKINSAYLEELKQLDGLLKSRNGYLILILPPLMPEAEVWLINSHVGPSLLTFKHNITTWASESQVMLIDAGQSERYNCAYEDFFDQHHALEYCYEKIIGNHFK